jgi:hypothetical protein
MKKIMLMAYRIFFVLTQSTVSAQKTNELNIDPLLEENRASHDTLVITLQGSDKILFLGNNLKKMVKYEKADSLKMLFLNDFEKAVSEQTITKDVQRVHYFVHSSGKRRLKAENPEYTDSKVDVDYEIKRLNFDIPKYQYVIHDLSSGYELHIYINNPEQLKNTLTAINLNGVIHDKVISKYYIDRNYKLEISADQNNYKIVNATGGAQITIGLSPSFGVGLFGNVIAPLIGGDIKIAITDKYRIGRCRGGVGLTTFPIVSMDGGKITGVSMVSSYDLKLMININRKVHKTNYLGLQAGFMKSNESNFFNNAYKIGAVFESKSEGANYSFDLIRDTNGNYIYGITYKVPF